MDWKFVIHHSISGIIPVIIVAMFYFALFQVIVKKQNMGHIILSSSFAVYFIGVLTLTGICIRPSFSPVIVYIPFIDMIRGPIDTILNVLLFIPMGLFLPILYEHYNGVRKVALIGFLISLSIEIVQMFGFGATDINDLITNVIGTCIGYCIYKRLYKHIPKMWIEKIRINDNRCYYEPIILWIFVLLIMITIQPYICDTLFSAIGEMQEWK